MGKQIAQNEGRYYRVDVRQMRRHDLVLLDLAFRAIEPRQKPASVEADYPCYACGDESTHEIIHCGSPLDVCDGCDVEAQSRWSPYDRDTGMRKYGEI